MHPATTDYNTRLPVEYQPIANYLADEIDLRLSEADNKIWHAHPVWFLEGNPIVGYSLQKRGLRLMFWSGADFEEEGLNVVGAKFKDASVFYNQVAEIKKAQLRRWLKKSKENQWDYQNLVKRKGKLVKLKG
ncbi:MAG: hypothetical protein JNL67_19240 [Planctomycetaceae bacterium]|nr:hypothetical protein [Planctomycetaceae bacterium]